MQKYKPLIEKSVLTLLDSSVVTKIIHLPLFTR